MADLWDRLQAEKCPHCEGQQTMPALLCRECFEAAIREERAQVLDDVLLAMLEAHDASPKFTAGKEAEKRAALLAEIGFLYGGCLGVTETWIRRRRDEIGEGKA